MKSTPHPIIAASLLLAASLFPTYTTAQDLSYSSGSTGVDGPLNIPTVFPSAGPRGGAVYHEAEHAAYYISSYYVWKTQDGSIWTRLPDLPNVWDANQMSGQLCYDSINQILYALSIGSDTYSARLYKLVDGNWQSVGDALPSYNNNWEAWSHGRLVFHAASQQLLLFGVGLSYNETWTFDGTAWTQQTPTNSPPGRRNPQMAYDPVRNETVMFGGEGYADTWTWNGTNWTEKPFIINPPTMSSCAALWHPGYEGVVIPRTGSDLWVWNGTEWRMEHASGTWSSSSKAGYCSVYLPDSGEMLSITANQISALKNNNWTFKTGSPYYIDLQNRPSGVFNYTDIVVPTGVTVKFLRNTANTPVIWMASGFVRIDGTVDVGGESSDSGPGGYNGATGLMTQGQGPGGGYPTDQMGGRYFGVYGNSQIEPLTGGSGGGRINNGQGPGGGGGGAILISASRDIQVNGTIAANGGSCATWYTYWWAWGDNVSNSGAGSGGAIKLIADRILGAGSLAANGGYAGGYSPDRGWGYPNQTGSPGRIRIEAYETDMVDNASPLASNATSPVWTPVSLASQLEYELKVTQVASTAVRQPPTGQTGNPDVSFSTDQPITVVVSGRNIPDGTEVKLMIAGNGINITLPASGEPAVTMQSGSATFPNITIPTGLGSIQASAAFQKPAATP